MGANKVNMRNTELSEIDINVKSYKKQYTIGILMNPVLFGQTDTSQLLNITLYSEKNKHLRFNTEEEAEEFMDIVFKSEDPCKDGYIIIPIYTKK